MLSLQCRSLKYDIWTRPQGKLKFWFQVKFAWHDYKRCCDLVTKCLSLLCLQWQSYTNKRFLSKMRTPVCTGCVTWLMGHLSVIFNCTGIKFCLTCNIIKADFFFLQSFWKLGAGRFRYHCKVSWESFIL